MTEMSSALDAFFAVTRAAGVGNAFPPVDVHYRPLGRKITVPNVAAVDVYDGYTGVYPGPRVAVHANEVWLEAVIGVGGWFYVIEIGDGPYRRAASGLERQTE